MNFGTRAFLAFSLGLGIGNRLDISMSSVQEIEDAIRHLSAEELKVLRAWFAQFDAAVWDRHIEADVISGGLDQLGDQAVEDLREGRCTDL
jgi:hypothetical protein